MSKQLSMIIFTVSFISGVYNETTNEIITGGVGNITVSPFFKILLFLIATVVGLMYLHDVNLFIRMPDNSSVLPHPIFFSFLFDAYLFIYLFIYLFVLNSAGALDMGQSFYFSGKFCQ